MNMTLPCNILIILLLITTPCSAQFFEKTPKLDLLSVDGKSVKLSKVLDREKINIISFWASWCKPCIAELNAFSGSYESWQDAYNIEIMAISLDEPDAVDRAKSFAKSRGWKFPQYFASSKSALQAFDFENIPYTLVMNQAGEIIYSHNAYLPGDEKKMEEALKKGQ